MWTLFHPLTQGSMLGTFFFLLYISNSSGTVETFYMTFNINVTVPPLPTDGITGIFFVSQMLLSASTLGQRY